jgi:serine protease AprX
MGARRRLLAVAVLLLPGSVAGDEAAAPAPVPEERVRFGFPDAEYRVLRDPATGAKSLLGADGRRFASVEAAVAAAEAGLSPLRRALEPSLWPLVEDPDRAGERVRVLLVLRRQPVHEASLAARARARADLAPRLAALRRPLDRIAPLRVREPGRRVQLGDVLAEEAILLTPAERDEARRLRGEVVARIRAMRREVLDAARPLAAADQGPVAAFVAGIPGARVLGTSLVVSAVAAEIPAGRIADVLEALPSVAGVFRDAEPRLTLEASVPTTGAASWTGAGYDGAGGTRVGVLDTGIDPEHPALAGAVGGAAVYCGTGTDPSLNSVDDFAGHGTHVGGIVASRDATRTGVAPGVELLNAKCFAYWSSWDFWIWQAADWALDEGVDVLNGSFGYRGVAAENASRGFFDAVVDDLGVSVACSAGNGGIYEKLYIPADGYNVVGVAALTDQGTADVGDDVFGQYSTTGPAADGRRKPDLTAPGSGVSSCSHAWEGDGEDWVDMTGTSMASPHVAGALGLLHDYGASWRPEGMKALLLATTRNGGVVPPDFDARWGWGAIDLAAAFANRATLQEETFDAAGPGRRNYAAPPLPAGSRVALCWNRHLVSNGSSSPTSYRPPVDLDLFVYDGDDGTLVASSARLLDTVERVVLPRAVEHPVLSVVRAGGFPSGQTTVDWALATDGGSSAVPTELDLPDLSCLILVQERIVREGQEFAVSASATNGSTVDVADASVALALPPGYVILSGDNPRTIQSLPAGGTVKTTWTVKAGGSPAAPGGPQRTLGATAAAVFLGEPVVSPAATFPQVYDGDLPRVTLVPLGGVEAVQTFAVTFQVSAVDDSTEVTSLRARNPGTTYWTEWEPLPETLPWNLNGGEGEQAVEVQVRDEAGNESVVTSGTVYVDRTPPWGTFVLSGNADYLLPSQALTADPSVSDGNGSGIRGFRWRWTGDADWSEWIATDGIAPLPLPRPPGEVNFGIEGQYRDAAGNLTGISTDAVHLVGGEVPSATGAKSWEGHVGFEGDIDAFRIALVAGERLSVRLSLRALQGSGRGGVAVDLWDPSGTRVVSWVYPENSRRPGLKGFPVATSGEHVVVLRPLWNFYEPGVRCRASIRVARPKDSLRARGSGNPPFAGGHVVIPLFGVDGAVLSGWVEDGVVGDPILVAPDGTQSTVGLGAAVGLRRPLLPATLAGGAGLYRLRVPAWSEVAWDLRLRPANAGRLVESEE